MKQPLNCTSAIAASFLGINYYPPIKVIPIPHLAKIPLS